MGETITQANIAIKKMRAKVRKVSLETASSPVERIEIVIDEKAYLSGASTSDSDTSESDAADLDEDLPELVRQTFRRHVSEDCISVTWLESASSYFILLRTTFVAARLLCHLANIEDGVLRQLEIGAVLYNGKCFGSDPLTIEKKLAGLPTGSKILQALHYSSFFMPQDMDPSAEVGHVMARKEFDELESMYTSLHSVRSYVCSVNGFVCRYEDMTAIDEDGNTECAAIKELFKR